jgi:hypothetical protein
MPWFRCLTCSENFLLSVDGELKLMGFYKTRWVEALDAQSAEMSALAMLRADPFFAEMPVAQRNAEARVRFDEIEPLACRPPSGPGKGFIFFPMAESDNAD